MATSQQKQKNRRQVLALLLAVILVVAASLGFQQWWNNRPETPPAELRISVTTSDGQELELAPYSICEVGEECELPDDVPSIAIPTDATITLSIPSEVYDHDWTLLQIFDEPAANDEYYYAANERTEVEINARVALASDDDEAEATESAESATADAAADTSEAISADATTAEETSEASSEQTSTAEDAAEAEDADDAEDTENPEYANLVIIEINSLQVDHNDAGEEIPVAVTWSLAFEEA